MDEFSLISGTITIHFQEQQINKQQSWHDDISCCQQTKTWKSNWPETNIFGEILLGHCIDWLCDYDLNDNDGISNFVLFDMNHIEITCHE